MVSMVNPDNRIGSTYIDLPDDIPPAQVRARIREALIRQLEATGEWPARFDIGPGRRVGHTRMLRYDVAYRTGPYGQELRDNF